MADVGLVLKQCSEARIGTQGCQTPARRTTTIEHPARNWWL